jgi:FtsP/CotA-like multicopper oxidase with cupredoxin domain
MISRAFRCFLLAFCLAGFNSAAHAELGTFGSLGEEQAAEKAELEKMKQEMSDIHATTDEAIGALNKINTQAAKQQDAKEIHLFCKEATCEVSPGTKINCLTYNGHIPGPTITAQEGQLIRIVLHNQSKAPTSLHFHGMVLPQGVDGLPRTDAGLVKPGETYAYQFIAQPKGTYWYHPQIIHAEQKARGLYGALVVEPNEGPGNKTYDQEMVIVLSDLRALAAQALRNHNSVNGAAGGLKSSGLSDSARTYNATAVTNQPDKEKESTTFFLMNGQCAPAIPAMEVAPGSRVRLRFINAGQQAVPIHLTGHRFEIVAMNGNLVETQTARDTITLGVSDRVDLEFTANNPGVWSLGSEEAEQTTSGGKFPGGMALVVRYSGKALPMGKP